MIQLLTEREIDFLIKLRALIVEYNAEVHCTKTQNIQLVVDTHLNPGWINPIVFADCLDETDIDNLMEETRTKTAYIVERYCTNEGEGAGE